MNDSDVSKMPTDPAPPLSDHEMLVSLMEQLADMARAVRAIDARITLVLEQARSVGTRLSELETRVQKLETGSLLNGSERLESTL